jgi:threonine aldolase
VKEFTKHVDNLMFCLSKSLSCPIGSLVVGDQQFIEKARKTRKILGGGMRQAGIIAAAGIVALETMIDRLEDDHKNAKHLAEGLAKINGVKVDLEAVQTNMVRFDIRDLDIPDEEFVQKLKEHNVLASTIAKHNVRMVTHRGIEKDHIEKAINAVDNLAKQTRSKKKR